VEGFRRESACKLPALRGQAGPRSHWRQDIGVVSPPPAGNQVTVGRQKPILFVMATTGRGDDLVLTWEKVVRSAVMSSSKHRLLALAAVAILSVGAQLSPATAWAQPVDGTETELVPAPETPPAPEVLHNVIYRARADGTSRRATVAYKIDDGNVNSAQPTMLPGQTFEVNAVLADPKNAGMEFSIDWPYGSNLHCEILVDDQIVAQADQFIAPRLLRPKDDPLYGVLQCGAALDTPLAGVPNTDQPDPAVPAEPPPADPALSPA
jgi:hypothetical protein